MSVKSQALGLAAAFFLLFFTVSSKPFETTGDSMVIEIVVSPSTLNLLNQGQVVTVHTNISYNTVAASTVALDGIEIASWKADNRGFFVAKFLISEVKSAMESFIGQEPELTLTGETVNGVLFAGSCTIKVISVSGK